MEDKERAPRGTTARDSDSKARLIKSRRLASFYMQLLNLLREDLLKIAKDMKSLNVFVCKL